MKVGDEHDIPSFEEYHFNSVRRGAGIATYFNHPFSFKKDITAVFYQITIVCSEDVSIFNIYRSSDANNGTFLDHLEREFREEETCPTMIVCAD